MKNLLSILSLIIISSFANASVGSDLRLKDFSGYHVGTFPKGFFRTRTVCVAKIQQVSPSTILVAIRDEDYKENFSRKFNLSALTQTTLDHGDTFEISAKSTDGYEVILTLVKNGPSEINELRDLIVLRDDNDIAYCGGMAGIKNASRQLEIVRDLFPED